MPESDADETMQTLSTTGLHWVSRTVASAQVSQRAVHGDIAGGHLQVQNDAVHCARAAQVAGAHLQLIAGTSAALGSHAQRERRIWNLDTPGDGVTHPNIASYTRTCVMHTDKAS